MLVWKIRYFNLKLLVEPGSGLSWNWTREQNRPKGRHKDSVLYELRARIPGDTRIHDNAS